MSLQSYDDWLATTHKYKGCDSDMGRYFDRRSADIEVFGFFAIGYLPWVTEMHSIGQCLKAELTQRWANIKLHFQNWHLLHEPGIFIQF